MKILDFIRLLEQEFPIDSAVDGDRVGLQIQGSREEINRVHVAYELNDAVVEEAIAQNAEIIIAFHPLIYLPLQNILPSDRVGRLVSKLLRNDMSLYIIHTNFDTYKAGTNILLTEALGLEFVSWLLPDRKYPDTGMGVIARNSKDLTASELIDRVKQVCQSPIKSNKSDKSKICNKIAIIAGSASSYISEAIAHNCDVLITADCSYHKFHESEGKILIIDPGHSEMEKFVASGLHTALTKICGDKLILTKSDIDTNPVSYS